MSDIESINSFIVEKRQNENWGLPRLHKWLNTWHNFQMLDDEVILIHLVRVLKQNNLKVTKNEVRNCFNRFYQKAYHGEKRSYLNYINNIK